ncbi:hypothetical protein CARUB_v10024661mg [Capsella rubella]|uniref:Uncharacterized protein n=1 Tax=Capsella rubella TaxID=81985 RepID=R0FZC6_9BRAS|nr:hypothetical protein CARUB_v10024661mg [Capsella rubella]
MEHSTKNSYASFARVIYDHLLVVEFAKLVFMVDSTLVPTYFSNIASFSKLSILLEDSWNLYLYSFCMSLAFV